MNGISEGIRKCRELQTASASCHILKTTSETLVRRPSLSIMKMCLMHARPYLLGHNYGLAYSMSVGYILQNIGINYILFMFTP